MVTTQYLFAEQTPALLISCTASLHGVFHRLAQNVQAPERSCRLPMTMSSAPFAKLVSGVVAAMAAAPPNVFKACLRVIVTLELQFYVMDESKGSARLKRGKKCVLSQARKPIVRQVLSQSTCFS